VKVLISPIVPNLRSYDTRDSGTIYHVARAEVHFDSGPFDGLRICGFEIWGPPNDELPTADRHDFEIKYVWPQMIKLSVIGSFPNPNLGSSKQHGYLHQILIDCYLNFYQTGQTMHDVYEGPKGAPINHGRKTRHIEFDPD
jgi:hypothetical protein